MDISLSKRASPTVLSLVSLLALLVFMPLLLMAAYNTAILVSRAAGTKAQITVDVRSDMGPIKTDFYHAFAQGGEESSDMLAPILKDVKALRPHLVRLDHIYDHYDIVERNGSLVYDFSKLDSSVDTILATGAKPLLSLSYMPESIAKNGITTNPPDDWNEWTTVVQKTIEHYSGTTQKNIAEMYYEVWNEPDNEQFGKWELSGEKNYLMLYKYAALGAQKASSVHPFFLGGPATTGLKKDWTEALVTSGNRVDFLSWHSYMSDPVRFSQDQRNLISWLMPYPGYTLLPKLITEYGFSGSKHPRYGTSFAAAHTAAVVRQLITGGPNYLFSFQLKDGPGQQAGDGWGLLTHEDNGAKTKPRYHVFSFLDSMKGNRIDLRGEGSWVTGFASLNGGTVRVLLVNYDENEQHAESVPVMFTNLDPGTYTYRERFFRGRDVTFTENVSGSILSKELYMPSLSVAILELTKR